MVIYSVDNHYRVCVYIGAQHFYDWERLTETVATIIAIIAAVAFWLEYRESKVLNKVQFIMELNEQFLGDPKLSAVNKWIPPTQWCYASSPTEAWCTMTGWKSTCGSAAR